MNGERHFTLPLQRNKGARYGLQGVIGPNGIPSLVDKPNPPAINIERVRKLFKNPDSILTESTIIYQSEDVTS